MTFQQLTARIAAELRAGGARRARALPIARKLEQYAAAARARAHAVAVRVEAAGAQARSGDEFRSGVHDVVAPIADQIVPGSGQVLNTIAAVLAPVLDDSLSHVQCAPGNPNYPACAIPGGSLGALTTSLGRGDPGMSPAQAAALISAGESGTGVSTGSERRIVRMN